MIVSILFPLRLLSKTKMTTTRKVTLKRRHPSKFMMLENEEEEGKEMHPEREMDKKIRWRPCCDVWKEKSKLCTR